MKKHHGVGWVQHQDGEGRTHEPEDEANLKTNKQKQSAQQRESCLKRKEQSLSDL